MLGLRTAFKVDFKLHDCAIGDDLHQLSAYLLGSSVQSGKVEICLTSLSTLCNISLTMSMVYKLLFFAQLVETETVLAKSVPLPKN